MTRTDRISRTSSTSLSTKASTACTVLLIFFFASYRPVIAQNVQPEAAQTETIQGTVVNELTGEGIGRALVYSPDNRFATLTDGQGHFEFIVPKPKESPAEDNGEFVFRGIRTRMTRGGQTFYSFSARKPGFLEDPSNNVQAVSGTDRTIRLIPEAIIKGRVISSETEGATGINIQLFARQVQDGMPRWVRSQAATANSNGEFRFADLVPGTYKIMTQELLDTDPVVMAPGSQIYGFPPICFPGVPDFASGAPIQLTAGQTFQADIPLARQPYFPVQIPVTNPADSNGLKVSVAAQSHPGPGYSLGYNPATQRIEGLLPRGSYLVEATAFGPTMASGSVTLSVAGKSSDAAPLALVPGLQIPVNVREEFTSTNWNRSSSFTGPRFSYTFNGGPRTYLDITLTPADDFAEHGSASLRPPRSRGDNTLVIDGVEPGRYRVHVNTSHGYVASATSGSVDLLREPLAISTGSHTQIDVTVRDDLAKVEVTVAGLHNSSLGSSETPSFSPVAVSPSAHIYWVPLPDSPGQFQESEISSEGQFSTEIAPGTYRVLAFERRQNSLPYRDVEAMRAYETQGQVVHLTAGQTQHVELQLTQESN